MDKFQCVCGSEEFEIAADTHDTVMFYVDVFIDGSFDTTGSGKEYVGETDYAETVECCDCGKEYELADIQ